jgi:hypothetical protein
VAAAKVVVFVAALDCFMKWEKDSSKQLIYFQFQYSIN